MIPQNVAVILARPFNAQNIGAVCRAMKNTGFSDLRLTEPRKNWRRGARSMARSAADLLKKAKVFKTLEEATEDLHWILGTTRRTGGRRGLFLPFDSALTKVSKQSSQIKIGIVFGRESKGLNNDEIAACDNLLAIPSHPDYESLNLAQAVMTVLFSLSWRDLEKGKKMPEPRAFHWISKTETRRAFQHFEKALKSLGFSEGPEGKIKRILRVYEALFKRTGMLEREAQMIKGLSRRICEKIDGTFPEIEKE